MHYYGFITKNVDVDSAFAIAAAIVCSLWRCWCCRRRSPFPFLLFYSTIIKIFSQNPRNMSQQRSKGVDIASQHAWEILFTCQHVCNMNETIQWFAQWCIHTLWGEVDLNSLSKQSVYFNEKKCSNAWELKAPMKMFVFKCKTLTNPTQVQTKLKIHRQSFRITPNKIENLRDHSPSPRDMWKSEKKNCACHHHYRFDDAWIRDIEWMS